MNGNGAALRSLAIWRIVRPAVLMALLPLAVLAGHRPVDAQLANTITTTTPVAQGGSLTITVTTSGVLITASSPVPGCPVTGLNTPTVTYACGRSNSSGMPVGTAIAQTYSVASGAISETVTYNANGPFPAFPAVDAETDGTATVCAAGSTPGVRTCTVQTGPPTVPGGQLVVRATTISPYTPTIVTAPSSIGGCPLLSGLPAPGPSGSNFTAIAYRCGTNAYIQYGTSVPLTVRINGPDTEYAGAFAQVNSNAPLPASPAIPAPTTQTLTIGSDSLVASPTGPAPATATVTASATVTAIATVTATVTASATRTTGDPSGGSTTFPPTTSGGTTGAAAAPAGAGGPASSTGVPAGVSVSFATGWNMVAGPADTLIAGADGPLYSFTAGSVDYLPAEAGAPLIAGQGYWAYFDADTSVTISRAGPAGVGVMLPAGQWVMIGNPGATQALVIGADVVYTYSAAAGYQATASLGPGQGGWAYSANGGTVTVGAP